MTKTFEIFINDLTEDAKKRFANAIGEEKLEDAFNEFIPIASFEFEESVDSEDSED